MTHPTSGRHSRAGHLLAATVAALLCGLAAPPALASVGDSAVGVATIAAPAIFSEAVVPLGADLTERPPAARERFVTVDADALATLLTGADAGEAVRLPLFADMVLEPAGAVQDSWETGFSWTGERHRSTAGPEQVAFVQVTHGTAVSPAAVHGMFWHGSRLVTLAPAGGGLHTLTETADGAYSLDDDGHDHAEASQPIDPLFGPDEQQLPYIDEESVAETNAAAAGQAVWVDVVAVYTPAAQAADPNIVESIRRKINVANMVNQRSNLAFRFRLANISPIAFTETRNNLLRDLDDFKAVDNRADSIHELRGDYAGDLAVLFGRGWSDTNQQGSNPPAGVCGLGNRMITVGGYFADSAFAAVDVDAVRCSDMSTAHEMGHNMGLTHDWAAEAGQPYQYYEYGGQQYSHNHGYVSIPGDFRTVMAYDSKACVGGSCVRIPNWSDPNISYNGHPTGMPDGSPTPAHNARALVNTSPTVSSFKMKMDPFGALEGVRRVPGGIAASGWALDYDTRGSIQVQMLVDGAVVSTTTANRYRPDVKDRYPGFTGYHGWATSAAVGAGTHTVCARGINVGYGFNAQIGACRQFTVEVNPFGVFEGVSRAPGGGMVKGWAIDPDTAAAITVDVTVDGTLVASGPASTYRADIAAAYPDYGGNHGFAIVAPMSGGVAHTVCVTARNAGSGANTSLGCKTFTPSPNATGGYDGVARHPSGIYLKGWALDYDTAAAIAVNVTIDGANRGNFTANTYRPDVGAAFSGYGDNHGFEIVLGSITAGSHSVCVTALNTGAGANASLGCRSIYVENTPFGMLSLRRVDSTTIEATGWAIDPDSAGQIQVRLSKDKIQSETLYASEYRADVAAAYPNYGGHHGFTKTFVAPQDPLTGTTYEVCLTGINTGPGSDLGLGCQTVQ